MARRRGLGCLPWAFNIVVIIDEVEVGNGAKVFGGFLLVMDVF